jgi:RNA polymerase sigma-70 factor (ECF subfamily)
VPIVSACYEPLALPGALASSDVVDVTDRLVESLARSEPAAVRSVYEQHHVYVRAFAQRLVGDSAAAEDLVHEVFVALPSAIRRFRGDCTLRTFLVSIAVNHARHHVRAAVRRRAAADRFAHEPPPSSPRPDENAARVQLARALTRALDDLPVEQRVAFVLCEVEERPSREVAAIVGAPEPTVRARLQLAKKKLRPILEGFR